MRKALLPLIVVALLPLPAAAEWGIGEVSEIGINTDTRSAVDLFFRVSWTGTGEFTAGPSNVLQIQEASFGPDGIRRVQSLLTSAFLRGKTVFVRTEPGSDRVRAVFLKAVRE